MLKKSINKRTNTTIDKRVQNVLNSRMSERDRGFIKFSEIIKVVLRTLFIFIIIPLIFYFLEYLNII